MKMREFIAQVQEELYHQIEMHKDEFKKGLDGMEALHLEEIEKHNTVARHFIHFFFGEKGKRNIDQTIEYLRGVEKEKGDKHPFSEKLAKFDEELQKKMAEGEILDWERYHHYEKLMHAADQLKPKALDDFRKEFNKLLVTATRFKETSVAKAILEKDIPELTELDHFKTAGMIWAMIYSKLKLRPKNLTIIAGFEEQLAKKIGKSVEEFRKEAGLPNETEIENWGDPHSNFISFTQSIAKHGKNHIMIKLLDKTGQGRSADEILLKGAKQKRQKMLDSISRHIDDMRSAHEQARVEIAAKKRLAEMVAEMIKKANDEMKKETEVFAKMVSSRVTELEKAHAKKLVKLNKMREDIDSISREVIFSAIAAQNITRLLDSEEEHEKRQSDIWQVIEARALSMLLELNQLGIAEFNSKIDSILAKRPSGFAAKMITDIRNIYNRKVIDEESSRHLEHIDRQIRVLREQTPQLRENKKRIYDQLERQVKEKPGGKFDDFSNVIYFDMESAHEKATKIWRELKKLGIESHHEKVRPAA